MVECEFVTHAVSSIRLYIVLIDTWWNVNNGLCLTMNIQLVVLIDTWWNVNVSALKKSLGNGTVLIDTWWNVNRI